MDKNKIKITIGLLIVIVGVFAFMNRELMKEKGYAHENAQVILKEGDLEVVLNHENIINIGQVHFTAILDTSTTDPEEHTYTGVPLKKVIEEAGLSLDKKEIVIIKGVDGYTVALSIEEVLDEENAFLAYAVDGKALKPKNRGGSGPYQLIVRKDQFSQRWCKFVVEIEVK